jgi:hypothetical protein
MAIGCQQKEIRVLIRGCQQTKIQIVIDDDYRNNHYEDTRKK